MKIVFLSCTNGIVHRGVETFIHELGNSLSKNHEVTVYQAGEKLEGALYKTVTIPFKLNLSSENRLRSLSKPLYWDFNLGNILRRFYLDYWNRKQGEFAIKALKLISKETNVLIIPGSGWVSLFSRFWCFKNKVKLVIAGQSGPGWDDRINLWCRPDAFIALSTLATSWARSAGFGVRVETIPNGVSLKRFNLNVRPAKIDLPRPIYLTVAALEPGKRIDLTIKAISNLPKGSLLVLGDGNERDNLIELGKKLLPGRFDVKYVRHENMPSFYAAADVITMVPVGVESFGIVYVEGMAVNKPVVATDDPIRREIIGQAGLFIDPKNVSKYSEALKLASEKDWGNIPVNQAKKYSWVKIAKKYENLFKSL